MNASLLRRTRVPSGVAPDGDQLVSFDFAQDMVIELDEILPGELGIVRLGCRRRQAEAQQVGVVR
jgi:hypothetical protein